MARSTSSESPKTSKRKGTRSVSSLTPAQLARKRANDREAQRAIRARTKEHIDRLEREIDELRGRHGLDRTVQDLVRRNRSLEDEVKRLRDKFGVTSSPYSSYDDNFSNGSNAIPSPRTSPFPSAGGYSTPMPDYTQQQQQQQQYVPLPNNCETWASSVPSHAQQQHSAVSSPTSSHTDDFGAASYMPTSMPMMSAAPKAIKLELDDLDDARFRMASHALPMAQASFLPESQQSWNSMYPMFYAAQPIQSPVH